MIKLGFKEEYTKNNPPTPKMNWIGSIIIRSKKVLGGIKKPTNTNNKQMKI